jgi:N-acetyl-anhydromuramyl-L-alanine amidase AmpD
MSIKEAVLRRVDTVKKIIKPIPDERPDNPSRIDLPDDGAPTIVTVKGVRYRTHGKFKTRSGGPLGAVIHFTVSGRTAKSAENVVRYMASQGLGCLVMDENGIFYAPEGYNYLRDVVYHAGKSQWKGYSGMSAYCVGIEICNWGTDATLRKAKDIRIVDSKRDNQKPGIYQRYTEAQEKSLIRFLRYLRKTSKDFSVEYVVGHDEIAPQRKADPGGSLSMTMPELRQLIGQTRVER